ncbi:MAG TPA: PilN domain-containing protein, partial [Candidatus Omnitrophota bacterium]|nr:PilN domain-containing protein [Candidatus Omnitrophota bacterium]
FLNRLFKIMPKETAIKSVSLDKDKKIVLRGEARELSDVFKFVGELEKASYITDVRTKSTRRRKVQDKEITDFELSFVLTGDLR